ncbi:MULTISPECIES: ABC transporter permease [Methanoculleus]|uniref:Binding-protein-dependent transport systems inner membrane component n=2 Tax=Methanoculleus TaxID=45989 RepID=A3CWR9_METMJ|nr:MULTISPECIES: ABC transporter permease [Methanoculleus]ABN57819.1 binding-protein-dependent transport systems inner membrane component [Methanoculleus marisnigri JR1]MCC7554508.1 ABC transporter permease [Methanoculleus marisnigri]UYU19208.1 ABC transporter permease [Methanoculleus submarinus]
MYEIIEGFLEAIRLIVTLDPDVMAIAARSVVISLTATIIATLFAVPLGAAINFGSFPGRKSLINLIQTLYSLPTVIVGLLIFLFISRVGPFGFLRLLFTPTAMIIAQTVLILPIMTGLTISALSGVDPVLSDTLRSLGATRLQFLTNILKEARFAILATVAVGFGRAISEVGAAILVGGNIAASSFASSTRVLTTAISLETSMGNISRSIALGIVLLAIALGVNLAITTVQHR